MWSALRKLNPTQLPLRMFGEPLPAAPSLDPRPDWEQAEVGWIRGALRRSQAKSCGGWYVLDATERLTEKPQTMWLAGKPYIVWLDGGVSRVAPEACPHMGASLEGAQVCAGQVVCPWHGLALGEAGHGAWRWLRTHDDGVLSWVQLPAQSEGRSELTEAPVLPDRPPLDKTLVAAMRMEAACEPSHIIQNRLDPWHGAHYHPHSFAKLRVLSRGEDEVTVRVAVRVLGPMALEVDARFHCPDARTIVMTIERGEGTGSTVETHATPLAEGRSAVVEAVFAYSDRPGFRYARALTAALRPVMSWAAARLWVEDVAYAERLYALERGRMARSAQVHGAASGEARLDRAAGVISAAHVVRPRPPQIR